MTRVVTVDSFDRREKGSENKFANLEEFRFKVEALRNKLLAVWAAELMGKSGAAIDAYVKEVIKADFEEPGDNDVLRKVHGDLEAAGLTTSRDEVRKKMNEFFSEAKKQLKQ
jgi:hypothetical protein